MYAFCVFLIFLQCVWSIPFPQTTTHDTIILQNGVTYEITEPITWTDRKVVITGSGAKIEVPANFTGEAVFIFSGKIFAWEAVSIRTFSPVTLIKMDSPGGHFQVRSCNWTTNGGLVVMLKSNVSTFVLEDNLFENKGKTTPFTYSDVPYTKIVWTNNRWKGPYTFNQTLEGYTVKINRNRWPEKSMHVSWLKAGPFYHPEDGTWCIPPVVTLDVNQTYQACLNSWFLKAYEMQSNSSLKGLLQYHPVDNVIGDQELSDLWTFTGHHEIDFSGNEWNVRQITMMSNSSAILSGLDRGWKAEKLQIVSLENSTLEFIELEIRGSRDVEIGVITTTSHVFFERSSVDGLNIIATGNGHVHVQDSKMKNFLLTAPTVWGSGNIMENGRVVTQPYAGHLQYSFLKETDYHVSPFYLGAEPTYRLEFIRNTWKQGSDLVLSSTLTKSIQVKGDIVESPELAKKMAFSSRINAEKIRDGTNRPLFGTPPLGHIWVAGQEKPQQCPDGTSPGYLDDYGAPTRCVQCANPSRSINGVCNNLRDIDLLDEYPSNGIRMGSFQSVVSDVANIRYFSEDKIKEDCYTCTSLCLGITRAELDTRNFTLMELLELPENSTNVEYCRKCALYCADISGCGSFCMPFITFLWGLLIAAILFGGPLFCFFCVCLRAKTVRLKMVGFARDKRCPNCGLPVMKVDKFCHNCGEDLARFFKGANKPANQDLFAKDVPDYSQ